MMLARILHALRWRYSEWPLLVYLALGVVHAALNLALVLRCKVRIRWVSFVQELLLAVVVWLPVFALACIPSVNRRWKAAVDRELGRPSE
jgi:hypothetical protein